MSLNVDEDTRRYLALIDRIGHMDLAGKQTVRLRDAHLLNVFARVWQNTATLPVALLEFHIGIAIEHQPCRSLAGENPVDSRIPIRAVVSRVFPPAGRS